LFSLYLQSSGNVEEFKTLVLEMTGQTSIGSVERVEPSQSAPPPSTPTTRPGFQSVPPSSTPTTTPTMRLDPQLATPSFTPMPWLGSQPFSPSSTPVSRLAGPLIPPPPSPIDRLGSFITSGYPSEREVANFLEENNIHDLNEHSSGGMLPLAWAIMRGRRDLVDLFIERGADVNAKTLKGNPMLFVALKLRGESAVHRGSMTRLLLRKGADPDATDETSSADDYADTSTIKYWLSKAREVKIYHPQVRSMFEKVKCVKLTEVYFSLVGQDFLVEEVISLIYAKLADPRLTKKPIVLLFCGPPGHGKTNLAEDIMTILAPTDHARVNCGDIVDAKWQLFGSEAGYVGSTDGTGISNFMERHHRKFGVVVFEEFEKLGSAAKEALLHPFASGEWSVKKPGRTISVDCSNIVFILTSNLLNQEIVAWFKENDAINKYAEAKNEEEKAQIRKWIFKKLGDMVKDNLKAARVPEFARRVTVIPFSTFSHRESHIIAENYEDEISSRYAQPPREKRLIGNLRMRFTPKYTQHVLSEYDEMQGASSIVEAITKDVSEVAVAVERRVPRPTEVWFCCPEPSYRHYSFSEPVEKDENVEVPVQISGSSSNNDTIRRSTSNLNRQPDDRTKPSNARDTFIPPPEDF
jgi:hypothetical protein